MKHQLKNLPAKHKRQRKAIPKQRPMPIEMYATPMENLFYFRYLRWRNRWYLPLRKRYRLARKEMREYIDIGRELFHDLFFEIIPTYSREFREMINSAEIPLVIRIVLVCCLSAGTGVVLSLPINLVVNMIIYK